VHMSRIRSSHCFLLLGALALGQVATGQPVDESVALPNVRVVAGESRQIPWIARGGSIASITASRITPALPFPIRAVVIPGPVPDLRVTVPPATPAGEYTVHISGLNGSGGRVLGTINVSADAVTIPKAGTGARVPVVLLNGFQLFCTNTDSTLQASLATFGQLASLLQKDGAPVRFFNNCSYGDISIEQLAGELSAYIAALQYPDGTPVSHRNC
jgi:hypothetical protein